MGKEVIRASAPGVRSAERVLSPRKRSREKGRGGNRPSSGPPPSPILGTYLVSVPEGNLDGAPRHGEIRRRAGVRTRRSAGSIPGFCLLRRLAAARTLVLTAAPRRRRSSGFSFPSAAQTTNSRRRPATSGSPASCPGTFPRGRGCRKGSLLR